MADSEKQRGAGVLCHVSSLPNEYGIGTLGKEAYGFVDMLKKYGVKFWQVLPLQQTGYGDSPYQSVCCTSGNPYFIDLEELKRDGLLDEEELASAKMPAGDINYGELYEKRFALLRRAYGRFNIRGEEFVEFIESGEFEDYALFMSLKSRYGVAFNNFPDSYKYKEHLAMYEFRNAIYRSEYCFWLFLQYTFKKQWKALKDYANERGVKIIGDIPLYVAYDSSDVWARPELFEVDEDLKPVKVAGVPPDYFSKTGQLWGNPLYNWDAMRAENFDWWVNRIARASEMYDVIRIDHFRGLDRFYSIDAGAHNAAEGDWVECPGRELFSEIRKRLGKISIIAEDLGIIDGGVRLLLRQTGFPGMNVMLFAFDGDSSNPYLPANIVENSVTYTGTHDNDTAYGYLSKLTDEEFSSFKKQLRGVLKEQGVYYPLVDRKDVAKGIWISALHAKSYLTIIPVQDILLLDNEARMNVPSVPTDNWKFRLKAMPARSTMAEFKNVIKASGR